MKIQYMNGGLANQVFQYIFVRFAELYNPDAEPWLIDDSFFYVTKAHNGYELDQIFGIRANLLSNHFDPDVWSELIKNKKNGKSIAESFKAMDILMPIIAESDNYIEHNPFSGLVMRIPCNEFFPEVTSLPGNYYYHGYWIHHSWFSSFRDIISRELTFPAITDSTNLYYSELITSTESIGVHIRRGDYVDIGCSLDMSWYLNSMSKLTRLHPKAHFFIVSDDPAWCKNNEKSLGFHLAKNLTYIEGNTHGLNYIDMHLLSLCSGMLLSNSAFCYLAALLSHNLKFYINPTFRQIPGSPREIK